MCATPPLKKYLVERFKPASGGKLMSFKNKNLSRPGKWIVGVAFVAMSVAVWAQVGANVGGVVADNTGAVIPGATVTITNTNNGDSQVLKTGPAGTYRAVNLQPAPYEISVEAPGFGTSKKDTTLLVGSDVTVDFSLGVAGVSESVLVTGEAAALVETTKSAPKSVIDAGELADLPVLNRQFMSVAQDMPGTAPAANLAQTSPYSVTVFGGVADQASGYTTLIDGAAIDDATWGTPVINMSQDAIQEFTVFRNQFDAQYGHALNAVVSVVTKSGGDQVHGTVYYFGRDVSLNARNWAATVVPPYSLFRGGATFGGPIKRNKTHYFGSVEYVDIHTAGIEALPLSNPFAAEENGNYPYVNTEKIGDFKIDHSFSDTNTFYGRYAYDHFTNPSASPPNTTGTSTDSRSDSVVAEDNWIVSPTEVNTARYVYLHHNLATLPTNYDTTIQYLDFTFGQNNTAPQYFPRTNHSLFDTFFINKSSHDIKIGVELTSEFTSYFSHYYENGLFVFTNDGPFNQANPATWPLSFKQQTAGNYYHHAFAYGPYIQDDWRVNPRLRLNLGLRFDHETNLRDNSFYNALLQNPAFTGINNFVSPNRGTDWFGWQPRTGLAWDITGKGDFVVRAGFGIYKTREREYWDNAAETQTYGAAVVITNPQQLQYYPNITAVLNGQSLASYVITGARSAIIIPNDFKLPYSINSTVGFGWKINAQSSLNVDYVHTHDLDDLGETDANLPAIGALTASNPRPIPQFGQVAEIQPFGQSWYDALQIQYRTSRVKGFQHVSVAYTRSRSMINGVTWYSTFSGTDRFRDDYAYNPTNTPNTLSLTWATVNLPGKIQLSGSFHAASGPPIGISAGIDLDGDGNSSGDRPRGLPETVGYGDVSGQLALINAFRASPCSFVYFSTVTCTAKPLPPIPASQFQTHPSLSLDMRATKIIPFNENKHLELFFEAYNLTNWVTLGSGSTTMTSATFLIPSSAQAARQLQWGARFKF
jgi:hypothetical protein